MGDFAEDGIQEWARFSAPTDAPDYVWTTREGQKLQMHEIGDRHLLNIIQLLRRNSLAAMSDGYSAMSFLRGEHAIDAAESEIDREQYQYQEAISEFCAEAARRGLRT